MGKIASYLMTRRRSTNRENATIPMQNSKATNLAEHYCFSWGSTCYMFLVRLSTTVDKGTMHLVNAERPTPPFLSFKEQSLKG